MALQDRKTKIDSEQLGIIDDLEFNVVLPKPSHKEGRIYYDLDEHAFVAYNDASDVTHQLGHEHLLRVFNNTGSSLIDGKVVYITGSDPIENRPTVALAKADSRSTASVLGMVTNVIPNNSFGYITVLGMVNNLDTSSFNLGDILYLSSNVAGTVTNQIPSEGHITFKIGTIIRSHPTEGRIYVELADKGALTDFSLIRDVLGTTWKSGLVITQHAPTPNQSVDYTNGEYFISGILKEITPGGTLDLSSFYGSGLLGPDQKAIVTIYVDLDETLKTIVGNPVGINQQAIVPIIPLNSICLAEVTISKDELGGPINIVDDKIADCRQTLSKNPAAPTDEFVKVSDTDLVSKHLEEALRNDGNVQFIKQNAGGDEYLSAEVDLSGKANLIHNHDDRYYTETELNNGQLDNRYYTETEINNFLAARDELRELLDTNIVSPLNDQILAYHSASAKWINKNIEDLDFNIDATEITNFIQGVLDTLYKADTSDDSISTTTSLSYTEKVSLTYLPTQTGKYLLFWSAATASDAANKPIEIRVQINDTITINESTWGANFVNAFANNCGFSIIELIANTSYKIDLDFRNTTASGNPVGSVRRARLIVFRLG